LLARNLFCGYMFGRVVDNTEGGTALWLTWLLSALGECMGLWTARVSHTKHWAAWQVMHG
jgi:hypothetical protein